MSFTKLDYQIIIGSLIAIVLLSFIGPPLGMTGDNVNSSDIPEFNVTTDRFDFIQKPQAPRPNAPAEGRLNHTSDEFDNYPGQIQVELGVNNDSNRTILSVVPEETVNLLDVEAVQAENQQIDNHTFTSNGETATLEGKGFEIDVKADNITKGTYDYNIQKRPADTAWYSGIPLIGGTFDWVAHVAGLLWHGVLLANFYIISSLEFTLNMANAIFDIFKFIFGMLSFIVTTYGNIITGSPSGFSSVIVSIPGALFSMQFARIGLMLASKLPFIG